MAARGLSLLLAALATLAAPGWALAQGFDLPWWVDSIEVTPPGTRGIGAVTISGTWIDTGAPDAISHSILNDALHFEISAPGLNVPTGDALTPWTLTEEFGPLSYTANGDPINEITGSVFSVDPRDRGQRRLVSGPDFLGWITPPPRGTFEGLGTGREYVSAAHDVSADGRVVVGANHLAPNVNGFITSEAFAWTPETGRTTIGILPGGIPGGSTAYGVSADGNYLAGVSTSGAEPSVPFEGFRWSLGSGMEGVGTINEVSGTSEARAVSRNGRVVVGTDEFLPPILPAGVFNFKRAFRYTDATGMQDLGVLSEYGEASRTEGADVSADGDVIVGTAFRGVPITTDAPHHVDLAQPFRWTRETGMQGLGNLPRFFPAIFPPPQQETIANAVSADGRTVVGVDRVIDPRFPADSPPSDLHSPPQLESAVLWTRDEGWIDLGEIRRGSTIRGFPGILGYRLGDQVSAEAVDVSGDGGTVIGSATLRPDIFILCANQDGCDFDPTAFDESIPFIWDRERGMRSLESVLAGDFGLNFQGWDLGEATAISDDGTTIVGTGTNPEGVQEAWRAVLQRNTRVGDANFDGVVNSTDTQILLSNMGMTSESPMGVYYSSGDLDADGAVSEADLLLLLANYDGRSLGDFNGDGLVDAADYTTWRDNLGDATGIADSNGDGRADDADLLVWRANYGQSVASLTTVAVPEPMTVMMVMLAFVACGARRAA